MDISDLSDRHVEFLGPGHKKNGWGQTRGISHQGEKDYAEKINVLSPLGPEDGVIGIERRNGEQSLTKCGFVTFLWAEIDCTRDCVFLGVGDGGKDLSVDVCHCREASSSVNADSLKA